MMCPLHVWLATEMSRGHLECPLAQHESAWGLQLAQLCSQWPHTLIPVFLGLREKTKQKTCEPITTPLYYVNRQMHHDKKPSDGGVEKGME